MGYIDVLIPLVGGVVFLLMSLPAVPPGLDEEAREKAEKKQRTLRYCGSALIAVAGLYLVIKMASPR